MKRRRAQLAREAKQTPPEALADEYQQPDLIELSRNLPSGWQVCIVLHQLLVSFCDLLSIYQHMIRLFLRMFHCSSKILN